MITLTILILLWFGISVYNIHKKSKKQTNTLETFNPFCGNVFDFFGFLIGFIAIFILISYFCIKYLP